MKLRLTIVVSFALLLMAAPSQASLVNTNGTFMLRGTNFPSTFGDTAVSLDGGTYWLLGGDLLVGTEVISAGANSEWLLFDFATPNGSLAGNLQARWDFLVSEIS